MLSLGTFQISLSEFMKALFVLATYRKQLSLVPMMLNALPVNQLVITIVQFDPVNSRKITPNIEKSINAKKNN